MWRRGSLPSSKRMRFLLVVLICEPPQWVGWVRSPPWMCEGQGEKKEAQKVRAETCSGFTEGFNIVDLLQGARALDAPGSVALRTACRSASDEPASR